MQLTQPGPAGFRAIPAFEFLENPFLIFGTDSNAAIARRQHDIAILAFR